MAYRFWLSLVFFVMIQPLAARPVTYADGTTIMQKNRLERHSLHAHYSTSYQQSFGIKLEHLSKTNQESALVTYNRLLWRKNADRSQANIFLRTGLGAQTKSSQPGAFIAGSIDYETRQFYSFIGAENYSFGNSSDQMILTSKLGILPKKAAADELNIWLVGRYDFIVNENTYAITPLIRLMYVDKMLELGYTLQAGANRFLFNWEVIL